MRTFIASAFALALAAGCASRSAATREPVPPPPEFAAQTTPSSQRLDKPSPAEAASDASAPIAPEDQIFFARDSAAIDAEGYLLLGDIANWVMADRERSILIRGYADPSGSAEHNLDLSERRANAAATYLKRLGVPAERVIVSARGENEAVHAPPQVNRRIVIYANAPMRTEGED